MTTPQVAYFPSKQHESVTLVALSNAVPLARHLVAGVAKHWRLDADLSEANVLIVSELVTNAVRVTKEFRKAKGLPGVGQVRLRLRWTAPSLFTEVWDINPLLPVRKEAGEEDTNGRGLELIDFFCSDWGAYYIEEGKLVWTEQRLS